MSESQVNQTVLGDHNIFSGTGSVTVTINEPPRSRDRSNLLVLLHRVKQFWVEGVLERSVPDTNLIELVKQSLPDAVEHPWERILELPDRDPQVLPSAKKVINVFEEVGCVMLILGDPGSGKTVSLLELARSLLDRSESDPGHPVPVVFNLSTWSSKHRYLFDWLIDELKTKYYIPKRMGRPWLESHRILLLLDGLDEVTQDNRLSCIKAINEFMREVGAPGMVVCSRLHEYVSLPTRLQFNGAIYLKPLTLEQVRDYLGKTGSRLTLLRSAIEKDPVLQELARTPLMLNVMNLAYSEVTMEDLASEQVESPETRRNRIFLAYIDRMLDRKSKAAQAYDSQTTKRWMSWLAHGMRQHSQSVFLIEQLQPSWLSNRTHRLMYVLGSRTGSGIVLGLVLGLIGAIIGRLIDDMAYGLLLGLLGGVIGGLVAALFDGLYLERSHRAVASDRQLFWQGARSIVAYVAAGGLIGACSNKDVWELPSGQLMSIPGGLFVWLFWGLVWGIVFGLKGGRRRIADIQTVEHLVWSWRGFRESSLLGLGIGLVVGCLVGVPLDIYLGMLGRMAAGMVGLGLMQPKHFTLDDLLFVLVIGLLCGIATSLIRGIIGGLRSATIVKTTPNQGMRLSIRQSIIGGTVVGGLGSLSVCLMFGGFSAAYYSQTGELTNTSLLQGLINISSGWLITSLMLGSLSVLWYGGIDIIRHYTLRLILYMKGYIPSRYTHFLDYGVSLIFLQRVGGGYIFIHRLLLEQFASMADGPEDT